VTIITMLRQTEYLPEARNVISLGSKYTVFL